MATYIPNATQATEPVESRTVESAALEFRTLKGSINTRIDTVQANVDAEAATRLAADQVHDVRLDAVENALSVVGQGGLPGTVYVQRFSGNGVQTVFTLAVAPQSGNVTDIYIGGLYQNKDTFTVSGTTLTFNEAPPEGVNNIEVQITVTIALGTTSAELVTYVPAGTGAVTTNVQAKLREFVSVKDFGAVGDGVADDTAAIQLANNSGAATIFFPPGIYAATSLSMTTNWSMAEGSLLKFVGVADSLNFINCTGNGLRGNLNVTGNDSHVRRLINIEGNNNIFSKIVVQNLTSPDLPNVHAALRIGGNNNRILEVVETDLVNTGNTNSSSPQGVTLAGASSNNLILKIAGDNVRNTFLVASTPNQNYVGDIITTNTADNGVYCTSGVTTINSLTYEGIDEAAVFIGGANASIGTITVLKAGNTGVRINNCGVVDIGRIIVMDGGVDRIFRQTGDALAVSNTLRIGHIQGEYTGGSLFQLTDGVVQNLVIGRMDVTFIFDAAVMTGSKFSWARADMAEGVQFGNCNITIVDKNNALTGSDIFEMRLRDPLLRPSSIESWNVHIVNSDRVTTSAASARINSVGDPLLTVKAGYIQANAGRGYLREVLPTVPNDRLTANVAPTVGTWKRGQVVWRAFANAGPAGSSGWVCVTAGTPGTWKNMSDIDA
jgi:hypothetical protein